MLMGRSFGINTKEEGTMERTDKGDEERQEEIREGKGRRRVKSNEKLRNKSKVG